jgi:putative effector of murein hydrolase LrgA (UPF0299 family)
MLKAFAILLTCQLVGEAITRGLVLPLPGPVLGLVILVAILFAAERWRLVDSATIDETLLGKVSNGLIATLGILFVPAGVGVIQEAGLSASTAPRSPRPCSSRPSSPWSSPSGCSSASRA